MFLILLLLSNFSFADPLVIAVGKSLSLPAPAGSHVHVSSGKVLQVRQQGNSIIVTGRGSGRATVQINSKDQEIQVMKPVQFEAYQNLKEPLKTLLGLTLESSNDEVSVQGDLYRFSDWQDLAAVALKNHTEWIFTAKLSGSVEETARRFFKELLVKSRLPELSLVLQPRATVLLSKDYEDLKKRYKEVLGPWGFSVENDSKGVALEPMVEITVQIAEIRKDEFRTVGVQWPESLSTTGTISDSIQMNPAQFDIAFKSLQTKGLAKVLASPKLVCRSGKEAQFLAGGEFPIKVINYKSRDIQWKKHGILMTFNPLADLTGRMSLSVQAEISLLDPSQTVDGVPGLLVNRVESHIDLAHSRTIALSGLIKQNWSKARSGLPALSDIPILGALFASHDFREERTDLVVFITPRLVSEDESAGGRPEGWDKDDL